MLEAHLERRQLMFWLAKGYVADLAALLLGAVAHMVLHLSQRPVLIAR
jgi:hypothetical protein